MVRNPLPPWFVAALAHGLGGVAVVLSGDLSADRFSVYRAGLSWFAALLLAGWRNLVQGAALTFARAALLGLAAGLLAHTLFLAASFTILGTGLGSTTMEQFGALLILVALWLPASLGLYGAATLFCSLCTALLLGAWRGEAAEG
ncbi:hypothetical protein [Desulfovibrio aminophilus]|uniref:hypothetical protein n=1 Tax=Desulfovibrio aminophilus TaxID=81425 RepID=UPI00041F2956|nr:hypothetical protein [Desulfovibrio aminophilus]